MSYLKGDVVADFKIEQYRINRVDWLHSETSEEILDLT